MGCFPPLDGPASPAYLETQPTWNPHFPRATHRAAQGQGLGKGFCPRPLQSVPVSSGNHGGSTIQADPESHPLSPLHCYQQVPATVLVPSLLADSGSLHAKGLCVSALPSLCIVPSGQRSQGDGVTLLKPCLAPHLWLRKAQVLKRPTRPSIIGPHSATPPLLCARHSPLWAFTVADPFAWKTLSPETHSANFLSLLLPVFAETSPSQQGPPWLPCLTWKSAPLCPTTLHALPAPLLFLQ